MNATQFCDWLESKGHGLTEEDLVTTSEPLENFVNQYGNSKQFENGVTLVNAMRPKGQPSRARQLYILDCGQNRLIADLPA